jgi:polysaccharide pyruvyl transferase WcaK-like protein
MNFNKSSSESESIKICLWGNFGTGNLGNECTLQSVIYNIPKYFKNAVLCCICTGPEDTLIRHEIPAYPISESYNQTNKSEKSNNLSHNIIGRFQKIIIRLRIELQGIIVAFKRLKKIDMLIMCGTGMLADHDSKFFGFPYEIFKWAFMSKVCRCKLIFLCVGAGPLVDKLNRIYIKSGLYLADYRCYRDAHSKMYLHRIGFENKNDMIYPDLAFSFPRSLTQESVKKLNDKRVVALGVIDYKRTRDGYQKGENAYSDYLEKIASFIIWLLQEKYFVRLIIGDFFCDIKAIKDLYYLLNQYYPELDQNNIIYEPSYSVEKLLLQISASDILISPRYHNLLLALMLNKPAISISYDKKNDFLMESMGLVGYCQNIEKLDVEMLINQFLSIEKETEVLIPKIKEKAKEKRIILENLYNFLPKISNKSR